MSLDHLTDNQRRRLADKQDRKESYAVVSELPPPEKGNKVYYDLPNAKGNDYVPGFGVRVTCAGHRSFILNYRTKSGRERRITIGDVGVFSTVAAREEARTIKARVQQGEDPMGQLHGERGAPTVNDLCDRFVDEHLPRRRKSTQRGYKSLIENYIRPAIGNTKVADVDFQTVEKLHRKISKHAPYQANRTVALLSTMFNRAIKLQMRVDNPVRGVEKNQEEKRERYVTASELARLLHAIEQHEDRHVANILTLCLLTGARVSEVKSARWDQFDLDHYPVLWTKKSAHTKQNKLHHVPLNSEAEKLLKKIRRGADESPWVFPAGPRARDNEYIDNYKDTWAEVCKAAGVSNLRVHDLRHSFASFAINDGEQLQTVGKLLGHTQPQTTARYAHLFVETLQKGADKVGARISNARKSGNVIKLPRVSRR
jgi:integrase